MTLSQAANLLTSPPGNLAYHLTLALGLALLFGVAQIFTRAAPDSARPKRWRLVGGGLLLVRLLVMAGAGVSVLGWADASIVIPPLDRFASLAGTFVFLWIAFEPQRERPAEIALSVALILAALGAVATALALAATPNPGPFNRSLADLIWAVVGLLSAVTGAIGLLLIRPDSWYLSFGSFLLFTFGYGLHLGLGPPEGSLAGYLRLAELAGYPLMVVTGVRALALDALPARAEIEREVTLEAGPPPSPDGDPRSVREFIALADASRLNDLAKQTVRAVARAMRAEFCLLLTPPDPTGEFAIATGYDLIREQHIQGASLEGRDFPVITTALSRRKVLTLPSQSRAPDLQSLRALLELQNSASALLAPMVSDGVLQGGILLLSPYARRSWTSADRESLEAIANQLAQRFGQLKVAALRGQTEAETLDERLAESQLRVESLERETARLQQELDDLQSQGGVQGDHLAALLTMHEEAQHTIEQLEAEIAALESEPMKGDRSEEVERLTNELQLALQELAEARAEAVAADLQPGEDLEESEAAGPDLAAIASIAQELRQPMSSILGYTDLLLGESVGLLGAMQRKFLERVRSGIEKMGALLNDLIQVTALETGSLSLTPAPVDMMRCIEDAVMQASPSIREKNLALRMDFPEEMPPVLGEDDAVVQIVLHLIENAIGASPEDGEVVLAARRQDTPDGDFLSLSFSDAGDGIPPEDLGRVFHRVYRADNALIQGVGDRGVGLSLAKALSEALGGRVWVESEVGVGSTFTVLMPAADHHSEAVEPPKQLA